MGTIIGSKVRDDGKIVFEVCVDQDEALQLKGEVDNIFLVTAGGGPIETSVVQRGKNEATMYFLIPKSAREELNKTDIAMFHKLKVGGKKIYTYTVENE